MSIYPIHATYTDLVLYYNQNVDAQWYAEQSHLLAKYNLFKRSILVTPIAPKMSVAEDLEPLIFSIADNYTPWHFTHITVSF